MITWSITAVAILIAVAMKIRCWCYVNQIEITQRAVDTDQDGLDDYTDSDDDNDGIPDGSDAALFTALSAGDISSYTLIAGAQSAVDIPSSKSGENLFVAELYPDGSLEMVGYRVEGTGSWAWSAADQSLFVSVSREENIQVQPLVPRTISTSPTKDWAIPRLLLELRQTGRLCSLPRGSLRTTGSCQQQRTRILTY